MKINKLTFHAFGPFSNTVDIDFDKLNKNGLFLLTGPTGVGKTSIFDAISFAIYGETTGNSSKFSKVVSDYKKDDELCYVDIVFTVGNEVIKIHREPTQPYFTRKRLTERKHNVSCIIKDTVYSKVSEVRAKMEEYIGLGIDQFKQIVMIPQGEFMKFLQSNSEEKMDIFRKLFNTLGASKIQEKLKEETSKLSKEIINTETSLNTLFDSFGPLIKTNEFNEETKKDVKLEYVSDFLNKEQDKINTLSLSLTTKRELVKELNKKIEEYKKTNEGIIKYQDFKYSYDLLKENDENINSLEVKLENISLAKDINSKKVNLEKEKHTLDELILTKNKEEEKVRKLASDLLILKKEFLNINNLKNNNEKIKTDLTKLDIELNDSKKKKDLELLNTELENRILVDEKNFSYKEELLEKEKKNLFPKESLEKKLSLIKQKESTLTLEIEKNNFRMSELNNKLVTASKINKLKEEILNLNVLINDKEKALLTINKQILDFNNEIDSNNIYKVIINTSIGDVCPICGNKVLHLNEKSFKEIDLNKKDELEIELKSRNNDINSLKEKRAAKNYSLNDIKLDESPLDLKNAFDSAIALNVSYLDSLDLSFVEEENINNEIKNNNLLHLSVEKLTKELNELKSLLDNTRNEYNLNKNSIESLGSLKDINEINKLIIKYKNILDNNMTMIRDYEENLNINSNEALRAKTNLANLKDSIKKTKTNLEILKNDFKLEFNKLPNYSEFLSFESEVDNYVNAIREHKEKTYFYKNSILSYAKYKDQEIKSTEKLELDYFSINTYINELIENISSLKEGYSRDASTLDKTTKVYLKSKSKLKEYDKLSNLTNLIKGKNQEKVDFERFIILSYYDDILSEANKLLLVMTKNRYSLFRRRDLSGNGVKGLDLDIYDTNTGKKRDVKTLSGGESFMTALSLALGLAEVIKQNSGGNNLETLFVDEGFGTLSSDNLDSALNILVDIKKRGYTVGVISHVESIKERIGSKIILNRDNNGSYVSSIVS